MLTRLIVLVCGPDVLSIHGAKYMLSTWDQICAEYMGQIEAEYMGQDIC